MGSLKSAVLSALCSRQVFNLVQAVIGAVHAARYLDGLETMVQDISSMLRKADCVTDGPRMQGGSQPGAGSH